jgi:hypothetical protein
MAGDSQAPGTPPAKDTPLKQSRPRSLSSRPIFTESESNVDGAHRMSITTVHFTSTQALRSKLARAGLLA